MVKKLIVAACLALFVFTGFARAQEAVAPPIKDIKLDSGIRLSYIEEGSGSPVIFIHGTLGDLYRDSTVNVRAGHRDDSIYRVTTGN